MSICHCHIAAKLNKLTAVCEVRDEVWGLGEVGGGAEGLAASAVGEVGGELEGLAASAVGEVGGGREGLAAEAAEEGGGGAEGLAHAAVEVVGAWMLQRHAPL